MELKAGLRLRSAVSAVEVVVVKAPAGDVDVRLGGHPLIPHGTEPEPGLTIDEAHAEETMIGKRYSNDELGLELLVTKGGAGSLSVGDTPIPRKDAKPLPASD